MTILLHRDRYYPSITLQKRGVVIHDSESGDGSSASLVAALQRPGDRPSPSHPGQMYGSGYHAVTDGAGAYVRMADQSAGPYSAPPLNQTWWHICMPGFANQTRAQWLDTLSYGHILGVAKFIYDSWIMDSKTYELIFRCDSDLVLGWGGYTTHAQVSRAWHETTHTDPGINFPLDVLEVEILKYLNQQHQEEEPMQLIQVPGDAAIFLRDGLTCVWMGAHVDEAAIAGGFVDAGRPTEVARLALKALELRGPLPDNNITTAADFAKHTP